MNILGIIAEYNPFHQGHAYHLSEARRITHADYVLVVMSGNYVQRGVPAMFDKYTRAEAALRNGADLILELPVCAATGSAEYFSSGAVSLLERTGIVTDLCFGSECGDLPLLQYIASVLSDEPETYRHTLKEYLKTGESFPRARALALHRHDPAIPMDLLTEPNNLLGIEYLKALHKTGSSIRPHTLTRKGQGYHEQDIQTGILASASSIRQSLLQTQGNFSEQVQDQLPSWQLYAPYLDQPPITEDSFSLLLLQRLRSLDGDSLTRFFDVNEELSNRIWNCLDAFTSFRQFTDLLKTRNLTRTAVSRALLHILLDIRAYRPAEAFRVLGFRQEAKPLLKELSMHGDLPILTSLVGSGISREELYPDHLYESVRSLLHGHPFQNEYRRKMLIV